MCLQAHPDFALASTLAYEPSSLVISSVLVEEERNQYGALRFTVNGKNVVFRVGNITPTKVGFFVAIWKRINGVTAPYDVSDPVDFIVISVRDSAGFGQFIFPKKFLLEKGVFSCDGFGGKRGLRVYPPWVLTSSAQAQKTQTWQCNYFVSIDLEKPACNSDLLRFFS